MDRPDQETEFHETLNRTTRLRLGAAVGAFLVVAVGVAVAAAASPSPSAEPGASAAPGSTAAPGSSAAPGDRAPGFGFGRGGFGHEGGRGFGSVFGPITITAIDGTSLSLKTAGGWTRTITVTDSTTVTKGGAATKLSDLKVGDQVRLGQTRADDGTYTVTSINVILPAVGGEVTAKTSDTITITRRDGTTSTIHVGSGTTYRVGGVDNATLSDVKVGDWIVAQGTERADGSLDAVSVASGFGRKGPGGHGPGGPKPDASPNASPGATTTPG
jgi:hypothetical protein